MVVFGQDSSHLAPPTACARNIDTIPARQPPVRARDSAMFRARGARYLRASLVVVHHNTNTSPHAPGAKAAQVETLP